MMNEEVPHKLIYKTRKERAALGVSQRGVGKGVMAG